MVLVGYVSMDNKSIESELLKEAIELLKWHVKNSSRAGAWNNVAARYDDFLEKAYPIVMGRKWNRNKELFGLDMKAAKGKV